MNKATISMKSEFYRVVAFTSLSCLTITMHAPLMFDLQGLQKPFRNCVQKRQILEKNMCIYNQI